LCRGATLLLIGWIGRNRRYSQQCEQPIETLLEILIDLVEDGVEGAHDWLRHPSLCTRAGLYNACAPALPPANASVAAGQRGARIMIARRARRLCSAVAAFKIVSNPSQYGDQGKWTNSSLGRSPRGH